MGARNKLNASYFNGALIVASLLGIVTQSWSIFLIAFILILVGSLIAGEIRPGP
mgnify:CR=1 FL=1